MRFGAILVAVAMAVLLPSSIAAAAESPDAGVAESQDQPLSQGELDQLVAPIALYPDALLAQLLMAATYPRELFRPTVGRRLTNRSKATSSTTL